MPLTFEQIDELIAYNRKTGAFVWKKPPNRRTKIGDEAGTFKSRRMKNGVRVDYKYIHVLYHQTPAARVAWLLTHGKWPEGNLLFVDGDSRNLRIDNLREATFPTIRKIQGDRRTYKMSPEAMRHYGLKRYYGITRDEYDAILASQHGVCAICKKPETGKSPYQGKVKPLSVDHNHETSEVRGLLCTQCNYMIGHCRENRDFLLAGINYLDKHSARASKMGKVRNSRRQQ